MTVNEVVVATLNRVAGVPAVAQGRVVECRPSLRITSRDFEMLLERAEEILKARAEASRTEVRPLQRPEANR
jgi:hypothetical protein